MEDNELNREIAYELLSESGLIVDVAENGQEAIKLLGIRPENYYELIFMDIQMPVMNGYEATAAIRALPGRRGQIPIIAMTANAFEEDHKATLAAGMDAYVAKPIEIDTLFSTITQVLENKITINKS